MSLKTCHKIPAVDLTEYLIIRDHQSTARE
nr:MAG TPA: hypothetical protein [Caudoviricetes sp.]